MLAVGTSTEAATCVATELTSISVKFGTTASKASIARALEKYRFEVPSSMSSVSSASIAAVISEATAACALALVK